MAHSIGRGPTSDLRMRILAALVLVPTALFAVWAGTLPFFFAVAGISLLMAREWANIAHGGDRAQVLMHAAAGVSGAVAGLGGPFVLPGLGIMLLAWIAALVLRARTMRGFSLFHVLGPLHVGLAAFALVALRASAACGLAVILLLFAVVWTADTLAYFTGRALGGPRLAPRISPGKTWSGFFGAVGGGALAAFLFGLIAGVPALPLAVLGAVLGGWEQLGDLFESALKRRYGVKDSGTIIPGHGGVLDRLDGLVAAGLLAWAWGMWFTGSVRDVACGVLLWWNRF